MGLFSWLEEKVFLGQVIHDYGIVEERRQGIARTRVSLLLCMKEGEFVFMIKESNVAFLGASVRYTEISETQLPTFKDAVDDAYERVHGWKKHK